MIFSRGLAGGFATGRRLSHAAAQMAICRAAPKNRKSKTLRRKLEMSRLSDLETSELLKFADL
jgi:hypothetical protein